MNINKCSAAGEKLLYNLAMQLDRSDLKSEISHIRLAELQPKAFVADLSIL